jgi:hypothetical protein
VKFSPTVRLNFSQELYTYILRCNSLNFAYYDPYQQEYDFSQVGEYFQTKENILYMRSKIIIEEDFILNLQQDGKELMEIKLRNC